MAWLCASKLLKGWSLKHGPGCHEPRDYVDKSLDKQLRSQILPPLAGETLTIASTSSLGLFTQSNDDLSQKRYTENIP
jgi:hypothetical protein